MRYISRESGGRDSEELLFQSLEPVVRGMGMALIELSLFFQKRKEPRREKESGVKRGEVSPAGKAKAAGSRQTGERYPGNPGAVKIRAVVFKPGVTGVDDCSRVHRGIMPRLELAFPGQEVNLEVSSPGIDRIIKDGREFAYFLGKGVKCYRSDISGWTDGILLASDESGITLRTENGETVIPYELIGKAQLS